MDGEKKGTIRHKLATLGTKTPIQKITQSCILDHCEPDIEEPWRAAKIIQRSIRGQYYRMIKAHPGQAYSLTYNLNCPPCGFYVTPWTRPCFKHQVCPWCFTRRLLPVYEALNELDPKTRNLHRLVGWHREVPSEDKLPFFRADYGPSVWLEAVVTVQLAVPFYHASSGKIRVRHIGIQLIPKACVDFADKLKRNCVNPSLQSFTYNTITPLNIRKTFNTVMKFPWLDLYLPENREQFEKLMDIYSRQRLLRISRYKPKGTERGN